MTLTSHGWQHRFPAAAVRPSCAAGRCWTGWSATRSSPPGTDHRAAAHRGHRARRRPRPGHRRARPRHRGRRPGAARGRPRGRRHRARLPARALAVGAGPASHRGGRRRRGIAYATRLFKAPEGATAASPPSTSPPTTATASPAGSAWCTRRRAAAGWSPCRAPAAASCPPAKTTSCRYARTLRDPLVADLIGAAEPLTPVFASHVGANRRLYPERLERWPDGLLVFGDSLAAFNPIYGHGMSAAARAAAALDDELRRDHSATGERHTASAAAISAGVDDPWIMAGQGHRVRQLPQPGQRPAADQPARPQRQKFADSSRASRDPRARGVRSGDRRHEPDAPQSDLGSNAVPVADPQDRMPPELTEPPLRAGELEMVGAQPAPARWLRASPHDSSAPRPRAPGRRRDGLHDGRRQARRVPEVDHGRAPSDADAAEGQRVGQARADRDRRDGLPVPRRRPAPRTSCGTWSTASGTPSPASPPTAAGTWRTLSPPTRSATAPPTYGRRLPP